MIPFTGHIRSFFLNHNLKRSSLLIVILCVSSLTSFSQLFTNYSAVRNTGVTYNSINATGLSVPSWRYTGGFSQDDNRSYFIDLGFDFWYNGIRYSQISVSTNGFIDFSSSTDDGGPQGDDFGYVNSAFTQANVGTATRPAIAPFYDDLTAQGGVSALGDAIKYQLTGTSPNRVFTMEWINMAVYANTSPSLNFQVKLYETTGVIEFNYGTMTNGTQAFSYTCGLNGETMNSIPTNAQLKSQQTVNTNNFSSTASNNLIVIPTSNSQIVFTPPIPNAPSNLTFSAVTNASMTLNWTDNSSNEVGFVIYYSVDGTNYYYSTQVTGTSATISSLLPSTLYYWKVYAVTEGGLSSALNGSQITSAAGTKQSNVTTGNWNTASSWTPAGVPTSSDNVVIRNGNTITINTNAVCNDLTIGQGGGTLRIGNNNTSRTITVNGNISITNIGSFSVNTSSNTTHNINIGGKITNDGTLNFNADANSHCDATFNRISSQSITGTGGTNNFNNITLSLGSQYDSLFVTANTFTAPNNFLTLNTGIFKLGSSNTTTFNFSNAYTITQFGGFINDNPNATINFQQGMVLEGYLRLAQGTVNIGNSTNENLQSNGGILEIVSGNLNIAGRYFVPNINNLASFSIWGGTMTLPTSNTTATNAAPFEMSSSGSTFNMYGGSIVIEREGGNGGQNLGFTVTNTSSSTVTGGVLQIGNSSSPANQIIEINSTVSIGNLLVNSGNVVATIANNNLDVINDVTITSGSLNSNNLDLSLGGNWSNSATWLPTTGTVTFGGSSNHTLVNTLSTNENFNHLNTSGTGTLTINDDITLSGNLTIESGSGMDVSTNNQTINLNGNWTNNGSFEAQSGLVNMNGTLALQNMSGTSTSTFYDLTIDNTIGVTILNGNYEIESSLSLPNGLFNVSSANSITLLSDATSTARIAPVTAGSVLGNFNIERFIDARSAGYSDIASPVLTTTFGDWDNELLLIYAYTPPSAYPSCWGYNETLWDYVPITSATTAITPGTGYEVWLDSDGSYTTFNNTTLNTVGQPFIGSLNLSSSITNVNDGWNLIGNPYASFISWDNLHASSSNISNIIMIYDETINDYQTYSTGSGIEIAPHQGFWIQSTGVANMTISETHKSNSISSSFRNADENFTLRVENSNGRLPLNSHTQFQFSPTGNYGVNENDISFIGLAHPLAQDLFSVVDGKKLRLNQLPSHREELKIPVYFDAKQNSTYKITGLNIETLYSNGFTCAILLDKKLGIPFDLFSGEEYEFEGYETENINRFELILSKTGNCETVDSEINYISFDPTQYGINVTLNAQAKNNAEIHLFNSLGQELQVTENLTPGNQITIQYPKITGVYQIAVWVNGKIHVKKFFVP